MRNMIMAAAVLALGLCTRAAAQEVTLRAVSSFAEKTTYSRGFERFVERVNEAGKGVLRINYIGGPKAMPPFEVGNALKNGVVDIANVTGAFYTNLMPEAAVFLARLVDNNPFHLYLNKKIDKPDLTGLKLRITPVYRDFFQKLGATVVQTAPGEVYTALERGVVDGYGWPITGIFDLGWHERTKYRVDPGFYSAEVSVLINKSSWDKLNDKQKALLAGAAAQGEEEAVAEFARLNAADIERQAKAGIQVITFEPAVARKFYDEAYAAGWEGVIRQSPEHGPTLEKFFAR